MNTDRSRRRDARLALADALFGPDRAESPKATGAALGKLWGRVGTGRGTTFEVRIGWIAGVQYLQFVETGVDDTDKMASILVRADALGRLADTITTLARYEGVVRG